MGAAAQRWTAATGSGVAETRPAISWSAWLRLGRAAAGLAMIAMAPVLVGIAVLIVILSRKTPLVAHERAGKNGRMFRMLKFRTMWGSDSGLGERAGCCALVAYLEGREHGVAAKKDAPDPRVTSRAARFLRRHSLDELPQLLHVAAGQMALVGPRPMLSSELAEHYGADAPEVLRLLPGMTGLWQVMGRDRLSYRQRRRLDLFLVRHRTVGLHLRILARTLPQVIAGANSC